MDFILGLAAVMGITAAAIYITEWFRSGAPGRLDQPESQPDTTPPTEDNPNSPSPDFAALIDAMRAEGRAGRAEEKREDGGKKLRDWITILLLGFTAFVVKCQVDEMAKVYGPIKDQADATQKSLVATQRAWLDVKFSSFHGPIVFDKNGAAVVIDILVENVGHSPALNIWYIADVMPYSDGVIGAQKSLCDAQRGKPVGIDGPGHYLFPGSKAIIPVGGIIERPVLDRAFGHQTSPTIKGDFPIYVYGCVDYTFPIEAGHHQTAFTYEIDKTGGPITYKNYNIEHFSASDKEVPPEGLFVFMNPAANGRTD
jgi:hypothetical protein